MFTAEAYHQLSPQICHVMTAVAKWQSDPDSYKDDYSFTSRNNKIETYQCQQMGM